MKKGIWDDDKVPQETIGQNRAKSRAK